MPIINQAFRTVTCDAEGCGKTVTFEATQQGITEDVMNANPWLKTNRAVQTADGRVFSYCSDVCMVNAAGTGILNAPEPKKVEAATGVAAIAAAAAEARRKQIADAALRDGQPAKIQISQ